MGDALLVHFYRSQLSKLVHFATFLLATVALVHVRTRANQNLILVLPPYGSLRLKMHLLPRFCSGSAATMQRGQAGPAHILGTAPAPAEGPNSLAITMS